MRAIAFAIMFAALTNQSNAEFNAMSIGAQNAATIGSGICIVGFIFCVIGGW